MACCGVSTRCSRDGRCSLLVTTLHGAAGLALGSAQRQQRSNHALNSLSARVQVKWRLIENGTNKQKWPGS